MCVCVSCECVSVLNGIDKPASSRRPTHTQIPSSPYHCGRKYITLIDLTKSCCRNAAVTTPFSFCRSSSVVSSFHDENHTRTQHYYGKTSVVPHVLVPLLCLCSCLPGVGYLTVCVCVCVCISSCYRESLCEQRDC